MGLQGAKGLQKKVESFKDIGKKVGWAAESRLERKVVPKMRSKIVSNDSVASTELFRSFRVTRARMDFGHQSVRLQNHAPHAAYVEFGTGGMYQGVSQTISVEPKFFPAPPMSPGLVHGIKKWMYMKPSFAGARPGLEFAIAGAIAFGGTDRFGAPRPPGTPASPFFFNTWFEEEPGFKKSMQRAFKRNVKKEFGV